MEIAKEHDHPPEDSHKSFHLNGFFSLGVGRSWYLGKSLFLFSKLSERLLLKGNTTIKKLLDMRMTSLAGMQYCAAEMIILN